MSLGRGLDGFDGFKWGLTDGRMDMFAELEPYFVSRR